MLLQLRKILMVNLRQVKLPVCFITVSMMCCGIAVAAPQNGIGAYAGLIGATENGTTSKGISLGADAQFVINDDWSINPYLLVSVERAPNSQTVSDGLAGMHLRRWFGDWFVGGQVFDHDRIVSGNGNVQSSAYGLAMGVLTGFEYANGWGAELQTDLFEPSYFSGGRRNAIRLHLTYRWH